MARLRVVETNFTGGELSPLVRGRSDLAAYENGAARLRNVVIHPAGGVSRRPGLRFIDDLPGPGRLVPFELSATQQYLLALSDRRAVVYLDGVIEAAFDTPWNVDQIAAVRWAQSADSLLVTHPDVAPQRIKREQAGVWRSSDFEFADEDGAVRQPYRNFEPAVRLSPTATTGFIHLNANEDWFTAEMVGTHLALNGGQVRITAVASAIQATAEVVEALKSAGAPSSDWAEPAFSDRRGWPVAVTFHQNRLVFGGSRDLPNRIWMSKVGAEDSFDLGIGLDDEAIDFALLSDQANAVSALMSSRHLQVFTSGSEWMISGDPMTPANVQASRQTRIGSPLATAVPPVSVDGATLFVARDGGGLREFLYTDLEQAYLTSDLGLLSGHLIVDPVDQAFDAARRVLHIVSSEGKLAALTLYRGERITAWAGWETDGQVLSVAAAGGAFWLMVRRGGLVALERFENALATDAAVTAAAAGGRSSWDGFDHLEGRRVAVRADEAVHDPVTVAGGVIRLERLVKEVEAGLPFTHEIEPLPPSEGGRDIAGRSAAVRLIEARFRLHETPVLCVDLGRGPVPAALRRFDTGRRFDAAPVPFTGDVRLKSLGWRRDVSAPLWRVFQDIPLPFSLVSVSTELGVNQ